MAALLVIGYGNPLRSDDGVGWRAAERLRGGEAEVVTVQQLTPELMEPISHARRIVFIDAGVEGRPGEIRRRVVAADGGGGFTHHGSPEALLAGARALYGSAPEAVLYTITGVSFEFGERLSPEVEAALERLISELS
jgi:hydrogenase maturation protease